MNAREILEQAVKEDVSDIFIVAGLPVSCRKKRQYHSDTGRKTLPERN